MNQPNGQEQLHLPVAHQIGDIVQIKARVIGVKFGEAGAVLYVCQAGDGVFSVPRAGVEGAQS